MKIVEQDRRRGKLGAPPWLMREDTNDRERLDKGGKHRGEELSALLSQLLVAYTWKCRSRFGWIERTRGISTENFARHVEGLLCQRSYRTR